MAGGADFLGDTSVRVDIGDFTDADDIAPGLGDALQKRGRGGRNGVVMAVAGALKGAFRRAGEGTGDHAADFQVAFIKDCAGGFTEFVKSFEAEGFLMAGDLENAVGGGVKNRSSGAEVLRAELIQNLGAGGVAISEGAFDAGTAEDFLEEGTRKAIGGLGKVAPVEMHGNPGNFPVAARCVLAGADGSRGGVGSGEREFVVPPGWELTMQKLVGMAEAELAEIGEMKRFVGECSRNVAERIGTLVVEMRRVGCGSDAEGVENEEDGAAVGHALTK